MRKLTALTGAIVAAALAVPTVAFAQEYPPPEGPVEVLPTTIDREPEPPAAPEPNEPQAPAPDQEVASDELPRTGADSAVLAAIAAGTILVGGGAVVATRRRRENAEA